MAIISAWAVGSRAISRSLWAALMIRSPTAMTHPIGTSSFSSAAFAISSAICIIASSTAPSTLVVHQLAERLFDLRRVGPIGPFESVLRGGRRIGCGDALDRRIELVEDAIGDRGRDLRPESGGLRRFVDHENAPGL